jgi:hypothetical protein
MQLKSFNSLFPHLASTDTCHMVLSEAGLVATFDLIDWHCQDPLCDCYTANFVITNPTNTMVYATIAYGWKPPAFYYEAGLNKRTTRELRKGMLDLSALQSPYADVLLEPFSIMAKDSNFKQRINRRYEMSRKAISANQPSSRMPCPPPDNTIPWKTKLSS